jgi:hypothetical protein
MQDILTVFTSRVVNVVRCSMITGAVLCNRKSIGSILMMRNRNRTATDNASVYHSSVQYAK